MLQRHALSRDWSGGRASPRTVGAHGRLSRGADLLRTDALQHRLPKGSLAAHPPFCASLRLVRSRRSPFSLLCWYGTRDLSTCGRVVQRRASCNGGGSTGATCV